MCKAGKEKPLPGLSSVKASQGSTTKKLVAEPMPPHARCSPQNAPIPGKPSCSICLTIQSTPQPAVSHSDCKLLLNSRGCKLTEHCDQASYFGHAADLPTPKGSLWPAQIRIESLYESRLLCDEVFPSSCRPWHVMAEAHSGGIWTDSPNPTRLLDVAARNTATDERDESEAPEGEPYSPGPCMVCSLLDLKVFVWNKLLLRMMFAQ